LATGFFLCDDTRDGFPQVRAKTLTATQLGLSSSDPGKQDVVRIIERPIHTMFWQWPLECFQLLSGSRYGARTGGEKATDFGGSCRIYCGGRYDAHVSAFRTAHVYGYLRPICS
jgi:hypothetical protein